MTDFILLIGILAGFPGGAGADTNVAKSALTPILKDLARAGKGSATTDRLVQAGVAILKAQREPALDEELHFLVAVAEKCTFPDDAKRLEELLHVLCTERRREDAAQARALARAATVYRNYLGDFKKEQELLLDAEYLQERVQIRQAKEQVQVWLRLGESYLADRTKAQEYFTKVLEFPLYDKPYSKDDGFKELYVQAALRTFEITADADIHKLRFHPVGFAAINRINPERGKLLKAELPGVAELRELIICWLEATAREVRGNAPLREHVEAVLKYARERAR